MQQFHCQNNNKNQHNQERGTYTKHNRHLIFDAEFLSCRIVFSRICLWFHITLISILCSIIAVQLLCAGRNIHRINQIISAMLRVHPCCHLIIRNSELCLLILLRQCHCICFIKQGNRRCLRNLNHNIWGKRCIFRTIQEKLSFPGSVLQITQRHSAIIDNKLTLCSIICKHCLTKTLWYGNRHKIFCQCISLRAYRNRVTARKRRRSPQVSKSYHLPLPQLRR